MEPQVTQLQQRVDEPLIDAVKSAFSQAWMEQSKLDAGVLALEGMSGRKYRCFINNLIGELADARYLEVGSWAGSTLCSAINGNAVRATAIDNWSQFGGPKQRFLENVAQFKTPQAYVNFIEMDYREVDFASLGKFNVYLFDGPHEAQDQFDGVSLALPALEQRLVLIVDDWNWTQVRSGTLRALEQLRLDVLFAWEVRTTLDNTHPAIASERSDWHNGYFISVLEQTAGSGG